ncbi:hypothetical protein F751_2726 [Auxenochlorella protothecoides]|uniref:Uncharacterized protein n=1 Tax=Auxenochlorella protothecoides TaxID=3075 RepID=A0A087SPT1_AUXPR|nr:hypothetical protein F751_2726 [Auxenochlorella protothecoides]KFM27735.1 hypothetical protein F751_2726 [Auxenochlorella protothecoides]
MATRSLSKPYDYARFMGLYTSLWSYQCRQARTHRCKEANTFVDLKFGVAP